MPASEGRITLTGRSADSSLRGGLIGVVGPCGSGKSTLIAALQNHGCACRHIAQEHSYVKDMWKRITNPDALIFLQASFPVCTARRRLNWNESDYAEQQRRLAHALEHANLVVDTDNLTPQEVAQRVLEFLGKSEFIIQNSRSIISRRLP